MMSRQSKLKCLCLCSVVICIFNSGCLRSYVYPDVPTEKIKTFLPPYVIQPPDELQIDALRLVPKPPYRLMPFDEVVVRFPAIAENLKEDDLKDLIKEARVVSGPFTVEPEGTINLGPVYGRVKVADLSVDEARQVVEAHMKKTTNEKYINVGKVFLELTQFRGMQQIRGPHLVRPDGTVSLGIYGSVPVAGYTLEDAKLILEAYLEKYMEKPEISVDVAGYNSSVYYVIFDGAGYGEQVFRVPVTGNETVLDAIGQINGLPPVASKRSIWIARPNGDGPDTVLPVDWKAITRRGNPNTNYQLLPGDRLYVQAERLITLYTYLDRVIAPFERLAGGTLLGVATYNTLRFIGSGGAGGVGGIGGIGP